MDEALKKDLRETASMLIENALDDNGRVDFAKLDEMTREEAVGMAEGWVSSEIVRDFEAGEDVGAAHLDHVDTFIAALKGASSDLLGLGGVSAIDGLPVIDVGESLENISCHTQGTNVVCQQESKLEL